MDLAEYRELVERIPFGKRLHTAVYIYREEETRLGDKLDLLLGGLVKRCKIGPEFNLVKFRTHEPKVPQSLAKDFLGGRSVVCRWKTESAGRRG